MKYSDLFKEAIKLYAEGKFPEAYQFVTDNAGQIGNNEAHIYNLRFCTACMAGLTGQAINI